MYSTAQQYLSHAFKHGVTTKGLKPFVVTPSVRLYLLYRSYIYDQADTGKRTNRKQLHMAFGFQETGVLFSRKMVHKY